MDSKGFRVVFQFVPLILKTMMFGGMCFPCEHLNFASFSHDNLCNGSLVSERASEEDQLKWVITAEQCDVHNNLENVFTQDLLL